MIIEKDVVSIVITCFNYGKYLARCVESAIGQTYGDMEIIVVDDGSTDNTRAVIEKFLVDPRIKYIWQMNSGQASAKNTGIRATTGSHIAFLDADDLWEPKKIEMQMPLFNNKRVGVVYSRARFIDANDQRIDYVVNGKYLQPKSGKVTKFLYFDNFVPFSSAIVRKECFSDMGVFDESLKMGIDWDLWLRFSTRFEFSYVDEPLLIYRMGHAGQMSKNLQERQRCSDKICDKFLRDHPNEIDAKTIRDARYYTYCSRGSYFSSMNFKIATKYFLKAFTCKPFGLDLWKEIVRMGYQKIIGKV